MSDILSQEEIDALLRNTPAEEIRNDAELLSDIEKDALGEIGNISMGTAATTLSMLINRKVIITTPKVFITTMAEMGEKYLIPFVAVEVKYTKGLEGINLLILKQDDVKLITDLMMGGDGGNIAEELSELHLSAISEAMNQMVGSSATSLSTIFGSNINISPPRVFVIDFTSESPYEAFMSNEKLVCVAFTIEIVGLLKSEMMQLLPIDFSKQLVENLLKAESSSDKVAESPKVAEKTVEEPSVKQTQKVPVSEPIVPEVRTESATASPKQVVDAKPVVFQTLTEEPAKESVNKNIELILDVPMNVTVELGRTQKSVRQILDLGPGSVIELDKLAGEPVDIMVNGKLIAKGEVVVIDENFGVRIVDMLKRK